MTEKMLKAKVKPETTIIIFLTRPSSFLQREKELIEQLKTIYLHFELHAFYGDVLTLKNAEIRGKVLFESTAEYRFEGRDWQY